MDEFQDVEDKTIVCFYIGGEQRSGDDNSDKVLAKGIRNNVNGKETYLVRKVFNRLFNPYDIMPLPRLPHANNMTSVKREVFDLYTRFLESKSRNLLTYAERIL